MGQYCWCRCCHMCWLAGELRELRQQLLSDCLAVGKCLDGRYSFHPAGLCGGCDKPPSLAHLPASAASAPQGMVRSGPWHSRLLHYGEEHMQQLRQQFMAAYPNPAKPLVHRPHARLLVLRRLVAAL